MQFHKALEVTLKFIAISKECKYLYQLISGEVQSVIHLVIPLSDRKYSYHLSSIQAYWHNLCLYAGRRAALCVGDAAFPLPSLAMFFVMWVIFIFCQRPPLEFAVLRRLAFSFLMSCRVSKHKDITAKALRCCF